MLWRVFKSAELLKNGSMALTVARSVPRSFQRIEVPGVVDACLRRSCGLWPRFRSDPRLLWCRSPVAVG